MAEDYAVVVAEAPDAVRAAIWVDALRSAGIAARTFERGVGAALGGALSFGAVYPVVVSNDDVGAARTVIADLAGASALARYRDRRDARSSQRRVLILLAIIMGGVLGAGVIARLLAG